MLCSNIMETAGKLCEIEALKGNFVFIINSDEGASLTDARLNPLIQKRKCNLEDIKS